MKFLNLLILTLCFCACATNSNIQKSTKMQEQIIPIFMNNGEQRTALKTALITKDKTYNFLLLANKKEGYTNFKLIGDFASVLLSINLCGNTFEYESTSSLLSNQKAKQAFEEILLALFTDGALLGNIANTTSNKYADIRYKYSFKKGENLPYKLKQKGQITKTFLFDDYKDNLPQKISIKAKFSPAKIIFEVLAHN